MFTYVIHGSSAKLGKELFCAKHLELFNDEWPEVEDIVPGKGGSLFNDCRPRSLKLSLYGSSEAARSATNNHDLHSNEILGGVPNVAYRR